MYTEYIASIHIYSGCTNATMVSSEVQKEIKLLRMKAPPTKVKQGSSDFLLKDRGISNPDAPCIVYWPTFGSFMG